MAKAIAVADEQNTALDRFKAQPERLIGFLKEVRAEMRKVITPSRAEVQATTTIVIVTVFLFAAFFFLVDYVVGHGVTELIQKLAKHS
jgi:preprotein translocase subunit SecE